MLTLIKNLLFEPLPNTRMSIYEYTKRNDSIEVTIN